MMVTQKYPMPTVSFPLTTSGPRPERRHKSIFRIRWRHARLRGIFSSSRAARAHGTPARGQGQRRSGRGSGPPPLCILRLATSWQRITRRIYSMRGNSKRSREVSERPRRVRALECSPFHCTLGELSVGCTAPDTPPDSEGRAPRGAPGCCSRPNQLPSCACAEEGEAHASVVSDVASGTAAGAEPCCRTGDPRPPVNPRAVEPRRNGLPLGVLRTLHPHHWEWSGPPGLRSPQTREEGRGRSVVPCVGVAELGPDLALLSMR